MAAWRIRRDNTEARQIPHLDPVCDLCILQDYHVNVRLGHPAQLQPETAIAAVLDVVGTS